VHWTFPELSNSSSLPGKAGGPPYDARRKEAIPTKVSVGNLSFDTEVEQLRELFEPIGEVVDVSIPTDRESGRPRGFAFVELATPELAVTAIEQLNGRELGGRVLRVNWA
jgi:RNA recognition motif-containing protein